MFGINRVLPFMALILILYPSSLLGWSALYGRYSIYFLMIISVGLLLFSDPKRLFQKIVFSKYNALIVNCIIVLIFFLLYFRADTFLIREISVSLVVTLFVFSQNGNFHRMAYVFRWSLIICLVFYIPLKFLSLNIGYIPNHGPLNLRNEWGDAQYLSVLGLIVDRVQQGAHYLRYSAHFLEPTWLWLYLFIFTNKLRPNFVDLFFGICSLAYTGLISLMLSIGIFLLRKNILKFSLVLFCIWVVYIFSSNSPSLTNKSEQLWFMLEKGFFDLPALSLFGTGNNESTRYGLGILNVLDNYGILGLIITIAFVYLNIRRSILQGNHWTVVVTLAFSLFSLKAGGFILPQVLYGIALDNQLRYDIISFKRT